MDSGEEFRNIIQIVPENLQNAAEIRGSALSNTSCLPNEADQWQTLDQSSYRPHLKKSRNMLSDSTSRSVPPLNWQETAAMVHQEVPDGILPEPFMFSRSQKGQLCKRFISNTGCPFGDYCNFLHDEEIKERESAVITLRPTSAAPGSGGVSGHGGGGCSSIGGSGGGDASWTLPSPFNYKTRLCKNFEATGTCPYGNMCRFAHGVEDLRGNSASAPLNTSTNHSFHYSNFGVSSQAPTTNITPKRGRKAGEKWKGPDKISLIYGDWIEDLE